MLRDLFSKDLARDAALNIGVRVSGENEPDLEPIRKLAAALRTLAAETAHIIAQSDDEFVAIIDKVIRRFYPHRGRWDNPHLIELINNYAERLERIAGDEPETVEDLQKSYRFCAELWTELGAHEAKQLRNSGK